MFRVHDVWSAYYLTNQLTVAALAQFQIAEKLMIFHLTTTIREREREMKDDGLSAIYHLFIQLDYDN